MFHNENFTVQAVVGQSIVIQINQCPFRFTPHETPNAMEGQYISSCHIFICNHKKHHFIPISSIFLFICRYQSITFYHRYNQ